MDFNEKLVKQITETAYLSVENSNRYRPIMRYFYTKHNQGENYLYKEEVYKALKDYIKDYTMEDCMRDLDFLVDHLSLMTVQDTENANTLEKFKYNNFRYEMSRYAIEIERMTIQLEELEVKISSLEPKLFERIERHLKKLITIEMYGIDDIYELWQDLISDFDNLNQNYQDFIKQFQNPKNEELLQKKQFMDFKIKFTNYINNFIKGYLTYNVLIQNDLKNISEKQISFLMNSLIEHQKNIPNLKENFDFEKLRRLNLGKFYGLKKWFYNPDGLSEGERLLNVSNHIISKITKYASSLIELHGNMLQRKEEYRYLCKMFDKCFNVKDAHTLSSSVLGVMTVRHYKGVSNLQSDGILESYEVEPKYITVLKMRQKEKKERLRYAILDRTLEKEEMLQKYLEEEQRNKEKLKQFVSKEHITLKNKVQVSIEERKYIFKLMEKITRLEKNKELKAVDPVFGKEYTLVLKDDVCELISSDGTFYMNALEIIFGGAHE